MAYESYSGFPLCSRSRRHPGSGEGWLGVNRCGTDPDLSYAGGTQLVSPGGDVVAALHDQPAVLQAELVDYRDLPEEAAKCRAACDAAHTELQEATASFREAQQQADAARAEAATAMEAAQKAQDSAEAAKLALAMVEKASIG